MISVIGEHDLSTSPDLLAAIGAGAGEHAALVVDLTAATFVDSTVLRALIHGSTQAGSFTVVAPPGGFPRRVLEISGIGVNVTVADTLDEAIRRSAPAGQ